MIRLLGSGALAVLVTGALILLMHVLIQTNTGKQEEKKKYSIPDIVMPEVEITTEYDTSKPEKPPEPEEPPPDLPDVEFDAPELSKDNINIKPTVSGKIKVSNPGGIGGDGEYLPIVKVAATYPSRAAQRGLEGYCTVRYTVTTLGTTKDIAEDDCPERVFLRASIKAASKFKYKPRVIDGTPIEVPNVRNKFTFQLAKDEKKKKR